MKCLILLKNADITLEENKMSPNDIYQKYRYHYSPECSKYQHYLNLFNTLDDSELELFKSAYNDRVSEELDEIRDLIDYIYNDIYIKSVFQIGAENILNEQYSTYADWGNIPRMGRNIFTSLKFSF